MWPHSGREKRWMELGWNLESEPVACPSQGLSLPIGHYSVHVVSSLLSRPLFQYPHPSLAPQHCLIPPSWEATHIYSYAAGILVKVYLGTPPNNINNSHGANSGVSKKQIRQSPIFQKELKISFQWTVSPLPPGRRRPTHSESRFFDNST